MRSSKWTGCALLWAGVGCAPTIGGTGLEKGPTGGEEGGEGGTADGVADDAGDDAGDDAADGASDGGAGDGAADGGADDAGDGGDGGGPVDDSALFNLDVVHQVEITLSEGAGRQLSADPYNYVQADVVVDGLRFGEVGVRVKGRLGSYREFPQKSALKVDLLEFGGEARLFGHEKFNLNNMVQDCAKTKELAAYGLHRMSGTPAVRVAYAEVFVDGVPFGLYTLVEDYDDEFLQRNFVEDEGNLYDGDYYLWPDGHYTLVDFQRDSQRYFELDEGTEVGLNDVEGVSRAIEGGWAGLDPLWELIDRDQHAAFVAATAFTGQADSYAFYSNNYRVYFDPARGGRGVFLPWDPDWAFDHGMSPVSPYGLVTQACFADPACFAELQSVLAELSAAAPDSALADELRQARALIAPALARDGRLEHGPEQIAACQDDVEAWLSTRGDELRAWGL